MSDRVQFSDAPVTDAFGVVTGSATAIQLPDVPCWRVKLKARSTNIGSFFIGDYSTRCLWEIDAGQETDWVTVNNLNRYWYSNASGTTDKMVYWLQK